MRQKFQTCLSTIILSLKRLLMHAQKQIKAFSWARSLYYSASNSQLQVEGHNKGIIIVDDEIIVKHTRYTLRLQ